MSDNAMPKIFTKKTEWMDWKSTLVHFLKSQPGRNGVPLNYVMSYNKSRITRPNATFLDDYVDRTLLTGRALSSNASKVPSYIVRLISERYVAEQKILPYKDSYDGSVNFMSLREYY